MNRRAFFALLGGVGAWSSLAQAQRADNLPRVAVLEWESAATDRMASFDQAMRELGYVDGQNVRIEYHYANAQVDRASELAAEIASRPVNVRAARWQYHRHLQHDA